MDDNIQTGMVTEVRPNMQYLVEFSSDARLCYLGGKMRLNKIRVLVGDHVEVVMDPYHGKTSNRIIRRL